MACLVVAAAGTPGGQRGILENRAEAAPLFRPSTKVVLFTPAQPDPLVARLEAELAAVGIAVRRVTLPPDSQLDAVITREIGAGASAAIRIIPRSRGTDVWTGDTTARVLSRRSLKADTSDAALSVIALRTVEFLRASLLEVKRRGPGVGAPAVAAVRGTAADQPGQGQSQGQGQPQPPEEPSIDRSTATRRTIAPRPAPADTGRRENTEPRSPETQPETSPATATVQRPAGTTRPDEPDRSTLPSVTRAPGSERPAGQRDHFEIAVGPAVLASPGGIGPVGTLAVMGRGPIAGPVELEMMGVFPLLPTRLTTPDGPIDISVALFGGGAALRLTPARGPWRADVALGASATMLRSAGAAGSGLGSVGANESTWKATGHARIGGGYALNRWIVLRVDALGGVVASRTFIGKKGNPIDYGSWGSVFAGGALALQASW
jgi:hypothetical protein